MKACFDAKQRDFQETFRLDRRQILVLQLWNPKSNMFIVKPEILIGETSWSPLFILAPCAANSVKHSGWI